MAMKVYDRNSHEFNNLVKAAIVFRKLSPQACFYLVQDVYFDFGAGMEWTTIVCHSPRRWEDSYQVLNPRQQDAICNAESEFEIYEIVKSALDYSVEHYKNIFH